MEMQKLESGSGKLAAYAAVLTLLNLFIGLFEILAGLGMVALPIPPYTEAAVSPAAIFTGFVLVIIGVVFALGTKGLWNPPRTEGAPAGLSFFIVGAMLSAAFGVLDLLIMGAHWIEYAVLASEDFADWTWLGDFNPTIWLFVLALPALVYLNSKIRARPTLQA